MKDKNWRIFSILFVLLIGLGLVFGDWLAFPSRQVRVLVQPSSLMVLTKQQQWQSPANFSADFWWSGGTAALFAEQKTKKSADFFTLWQLTPNFSVLLVGEKTIGFWMDELSAAERTTVVQAGIPLALDLWVMPKTLTPDWLPVPTTGVIFTGTRLGKSLQDFGVEHDLVLIEVKDALGVRIDLTQEDWELFVGE